MKNKFYIYIYFDPRKPGNYKYGEFEFDYEPFYIGKGKGKRFRDHINQARNTNKNSYTLNKIRKILRSEKEPIILKYDESINESYCFDVEIKLISNIGRYDLGLGPLGNLTNGGEGCSGIIPNGETKKKLSEASRRRINVNHSEETKKKLSEFQTGKSFEDKVGIKRAKKWRRNISKGNKGHKVSEETREKIRLQKGWKHTKESREKIRKAGIGRTPWNKGIKKILQYDLEENFINEWDSFKDITNKLKIPASNICKCCKGERNKAGNYIWKYK